MVELVCIGCPRGCQLHVDEEHDYMVSGNSCPVGEEYGRNELQNPTRVLTTTVRIRNALHHQLPVRSNGALPKSQLFEAISLLKQIELTSPVHQGEVIVENILDSGIDIVACRDL